MSVQGNYLKTIADAIREKDGTGAPIPAKTFAERIRAIKTGGGFAFPLIVTADSGTEVTGTKGDTVITAVSDASGTVRIIVPEPGIWSISAQQSGNEMQTQVEVPDGYQVSFGRLPTGYIEIEYIESTGTQCIDTEALLTQKTKLTMDVHPSNAGGSLFGSVYTISSSSYSRFNIYIEGDLKVRALYGTDGSQDASFSTSVLGRYDVSLDGNGYIATYGYGKASGTITSKTSSSIGLNPSIYLLASHISTGASSFLRAKLYSCQIYNSGVIVRDFIPCITTNGEAGLFDLISKKFFGNVGIGNFIAGPAV